jgi:hypothetical protein
MATERHTRVPGRSSELTDVTNSAAFGEEEPFAESASPLPRQGRRLSDKILVAFHQACDVTDLEIADYLLRTLEVMVTRKPSPNQTGRRRDMESLVAAHERLWWLRHPQADE